MSKEKFSPDEAYKAHKETTWHGPMPPDPAISDARIAEIRAENEVYLEKGVSAIVRHLARNTRDLLAALDAAKAERDEAESTWPEWASKILATLFEYGCDPEPDGVDLPTMLEQFIVDSGSEKWGARALAAEAERDKLKAELEELDFLRHEGGPDSVAAIEAERDRAMKACEEIAKRFTPRRLRYAPKNRLIIGVERPPFEETTFYYDIIWSESRQQFVTPCVEALNGASHFLDPRDLIGLPPQERKPRKPRAALAQEPS